MTQLTTQQQVQGLQVQGMQEQLERFQKILDAQSAQPSRPAQSEPASSLASAATVGSAADAALKAMKSAEARAKAALYMEREAIDPRLNEGLRADDTTAAALGARAVSPTLTAYQLQTQMSHASDTAAVRSAHRWAERSELGRVSGGVGGHGGGDRAADAALAKLQTENAVLRDRLHLAESALEAFQLHEQQERTAAAVAQRALEASEQARQVLRTELLNSRRAQEEAEAELLALRQQPAPHIRGGKQPSETSRTRLHVDLGL